MRISTGWCSAEPIGVADYDRDGRQDLVIRQTSSKDIWLVPGQGGRGALSTVGPVRLYAGAQAAAMATWAPVGVGDWDRDGFPDLMFHERTRGGPYSGWAVYEIAGNGQRATQTGYVRGTAGLLGEAYTPFGVSDWDRDGHRDLVVRDDSTGDLWLYRGASVRGYSPYAPMRIGNGWY